MEHYFQLNLKQRFLLLQSWHLSQEEYFLRACDLLNGGGESFSFKPLFSLGRSTRALCPFLSSTEQWAWVAATSGFSPRAIFPEDPEPGKEARAGFPLVPKLWAFLFFCHLLHSFYSHSKILLSTAKIPFLGKEK